jgi:ribonuclease HI
MGKGKKFYAVVRGRKPGIYQRWFGPGGAESQVRGFPGARFRGFPTRREAEVFMESGGGSPARRSPRKGGLRTETAPVGDPPFSGEPDVVLYSDGGAIGNPGPGGYGVVRIAGGERTELSGGFRRTTNNRMELSGAIAALETTAPRCRVVLVTDSRYVVDGITKGWARRWRENGWMRTKTEPALNADLWERLLHLCEERAVDLRWVRGHAGHEENERCDALARMAAAKPGLPPDRGYGG